jgi:hypothetical protein
MTFDEWEKHRGFSWEERGIAQSAWEAGQEELERQLAATTPETESGDTACVEDDGCPTERPVLQRNWRELTQQLAEREKQIVMLREVVVIAAQRGDLFEHDQAQAEAALAATEPK